MTTEHWCETERRRESSVGCGKRNGERGVARWNVCFRLPTRLSNEQTNTKKQEGRRKLRACTAAHATGRHCDVGDRPRRIRRLPARGGRAVRDSSGCLCFARHGRSSRSSLRPTIIVVSTWIAPRFSECAVRCAVRGSRRNQSTSCSVVQSSSSSSRAAAVASRPRQRRSTLALRTGRRPSPWCGPATRSRSARLSPRGSWRPSVAESRPRARRGARCIGTVLWNGS
jgi:hypothetical protein